MPPDHELPDRTAGVLATIYLVFTEGYLATGEDARADLCAEAIRLGRILAGLMPDEPEVQGLLALILLTEARHPARFAEGVIVPLSEQNRLLWDAALVEEGHALVRSCLRRNAPGRYQLLAAVNAVHTDAARAEDTAWDQIVALYDQLLAVAPGPVVALNRAIAVAELRGPREGLRLVDALDLDGYHALHVARADFLRRLGRPGESAAAYARAVALAPNEVVRNYLRRRRDELTAPELPSAR